MQGMSKAKAIPLTALMPILTPVKDPGPTFIAIQSMSLRLVLALFNISSTIGIRVCECVRLVLTNERAIIFESDSIAQDAETAVESILSIFNQYPPQFRKFFDRPAPLGRG